MYCKYCGKNLPDTNAFCTYCGRPTGIQPQNELSYWVALAREGNQQAISVLYEKTYSKVFYTVKSSIKDEDVVLDILQDAYIKAFTHLNTFAGNENFLAWVKQIAANTARDWLKKKRPQLFSEMTSSDEQDTPPEELFADERNDYIPEHVIDQNETKRLIREIIDDLPDDQRAVIGMYYYEEMSIKEISAAMESTESAVKSRLMYGRKKIEKKVRELEKRGTKLYGLAPIPFLLLLFRNQDASASELANSQILQRVLENAPSIGRTAFPTAGTQAGASVGTQAGTTASVVGTLGTAKIVLISIIAAVAIGSGIFGATWFRSYSNNHQNDAVMETNTENSMETVEPAAETSPVDEALEQYRIIINNASSYRYNPYDDPNINEKYRYALVQMQTEDTVPTLLLEQETSDHMYYMRAFKYDPDSKTVHQPPENLMEGVASSGGYRGGIAMAGDGRGIIEMDGSSQGMAIFYRAVLNGDSLVKTKEWEGNIFQTDPNIPTVDIDWHDIGDLSALGSLPATSSDSGAAGAEAAVPAAAPAAIPTDGDRIVLTGTVGLYTYDEVLSLQGISDPNASVPAQYKSKNPIRLIVLDTPQTIEATNGDGDGLRSGVASMIDVSHAGGLEQYDGQHVIFSIDTNHTGWPSDTSLPLGEPGTSDIHILN
ncbi:MAG: sigma-70 family RNA polymerase sigma factor [Oscillospiraceae bacterium]|nr:sigma-70 family RNA polymerase sigma factor [Oscillospiraceae bacterium]